MIHAPMSAIGRILLQSGLAYSKLEVGKLVANLATRAAGFTMLSIILDDGFEADKREDEYSDLNDNIVGSLASHYGTRQTDGRFVYSYLIASTMSLIEGSHRFFQVQDLRSLMLNH